MNSSTTQFSDISVSSSNAIVNHGEDLVETTVSSVSTREIQQPELATDYVLTDTLIPQDFVVDAKPFIERPFYLTTVDWDTTKARGSLLYCEYPQMPGDVLRSNPSLLSATKIASLYRCDLELVVSVAGTITHAGCVLVGVIPPLYGSLDLNVSQIALINTILTGPHVRLFANEATSAILKVPWYCNTEMATLDLEPKSAYVPSVDITPINGNYGTLVFMVLNTLSPSAGSSNSLKITVEAVFKSLDMRVPTPRYVKWQSQSSFLTSIGTAVADSLQTKAKSITGDFIDKARAYLKFKTGLHNPNSSIINERVITTDRNFLNTVDTQTYFETLDSHLGVNRIVDCPVFNTTDDEMTVQHIISKKQYLGTFRLNQDDPVGKLLWARPISPNQYSYDSSEPYNEFSNNIRLLHVLSRAWRGDIKITIEAVMNNKQQVKLRLLQLYNPGTDAAFYVPEYKSILNAPSHLMEFSAGGQTHDIILPYLCRNEMTPCAIDPGTEGLFHGLYYIYVAQPLANSGDSPKDVYFNVYITGTDSLQFFGYAVQSLNTSFPGVISAQSVAKKFQSQSMRVMNEPQKQDDKLPEKEPRKYVNRLQRIDSVRDFIRRMYNVSKVSRELQPGYNYFAFDLDPIFGEAPPEFVTRENPMQAIARMYYGKFPSSKFQVKIVSFKQSSEKPNDVIVSSVYYVPQSQFAYAIEGLVYGSSMDDYAASQILSDQNLDFPVPFQSLPITWNPNVFAHEFSVPNTSIFKFVGGPKKNNALTFIDPDKKFATQDCGTIVLVVFNPFNEPIPTELLFYAGANDECRFGFHSVAPFVKLPLFGDNKILTPGYGSYGDLNLYPSVTPPPTMNFTRT